jgi:dihydropteroate synthase
MLNLTPDSFSDGGRLGDLAAVLERADRMVDEGAALLDVGGESTRPGSAPVDEAEELRRVLPAIEALAERFSIPISIDTRKSSVAAAALDAGASIVNDVSALAFDRRMAEVVSEKGAGAVLMHSRGTPDVMQRLVRYDEGVEVEVERELRDAVDRALEAGIERDAIVLDPGIGFAKTAAQSLRLLARMDRLTGLGFPLLVGPSRKSFLGELLGLSPEERVLASAVACAMAYLRGARIFRVHDVAAAVQALRLAHAMEEARIGSQWVGDAGGPIAIRRMRGEQ